MTQENRSWLLDLEKRTQRARLLAASPEYVYESLREYALEQARWRFASPDEMLELGLLARGETLVDIALASFAASSRIVMELWRRTAGEHYAEVQVRKGIRLGCLSNHTVRTDRFPVSIIGMAELDALFTAADREEAHTLIRNDKLDEGLLVALYRRQEPFVRSDDEAWRTLVMQSAHNAQINGNQEDEFDDDLEQSDLHAAIFHLLETAPVTGPWVVCLHYFLETLDPQRVPKPPVGRIAALLERWSAAEVLDKDGAAQGGVYPGISYGDEFRCIVAALYGGSRAEGKQLVILGKPDSTSVAERCAYYGNAAMDGREIEAYVRREPLVFAYAASCNPLVMSDAKLRRKLEEGASGRDFKDRYLTVLQFYQKRWPRLEFAPLAAWLKSDAAQARAAASVAPQDAQSGEIEQKLGRIVARLQWIERSTKIIYLGLIALAVLILLHPGR